VPDRPGLPAERSGTSPAEASSRRRAPTLQEVAEVAGLSRATVSRVINGSDQVSEQARHAARAAIAQLGYVPNRAARSLVTRRTDLLALIIQDRPDAAFSDAFVVGVLRGVNQTLSPTDLQLVLIHAQDEAQQERALRYVGNGHVDGVLVLSLHGDDTLPSALHAARMPLVLASYTESPRTAGDQGAERMGGEMIRLLLARIADQGRAAERACRKGPY
jgi:DNA-binding LacI/PurR family transcriptional regulator